MCFARLDELIVQANSHSQGLKRVFIKNEDTDSSLTQFAFGSMQEGESSGLHTHSSMDEYFYIIKGQGLFIVEENCYELVPSSFVRVSSGQCHELKCTGDDGLEFVYFGISIGD